MRCADLEARSYLTLSQIGSLPPLPKFFRRGNDSCSAFGTMRHADGVAGVDSTFP